MNFSKREPYAPPTYSSEDKVKLKESFIKDLLKEFDDKDSLLHDLRLPQELNERFESRINCWKNGHYNGRILYGRREEDLEENENLIKFPKYKSDVINAIEHDYKNWPNSFFEKQYKKIQSVLEEEYTNVYKSPLLHKHLRQVGQADRENKPANIVFSARSFTTDKMRYHGKLKKTDKAYYAYETRTVPRQHQLDRLA